MRARVGGRLLPFHAAREVLDALASVAPERVAALRTTHQPALALVDPSLPMTRAMQARHARMRLLEDLPNVKLGQRPLEEALRSMFEDLADLSVVVTVHEDGWDRESEALLEAAPGVRVEGARREVRAREGDPVAQAERAFGCHAFWVAAAYAEDWLAEDPGSLRARYVAGLSAHHRDPFDPALASQAAAHLRRVVAEASARAHERAHARYRLAVHAVRHEGDAERGLREAEAALEAAREVDRDPSFAGLGACFVGWALNARALAHYRLGRSALAAADLEEALSGLEALRLEPPLDSYVEDSMTTMRMNLARVRP